MIITICIPSGAMHNEYFTMLDEINFTTVQRRAMLIPTIPCIHAPLQTCDTRFFTSTAPPAIHACWKAVTCASHETKIQWISSRARNVALEYRYQLYSTTGVHLTTMSRHTFGLIPNQTRQAVLLCRIDLNLQHMQHL